VFDQADSYEWIISPAIATEYLDVLRRPELVRKYHAVGTRDLRTVLDQIATATVVEPAVVPAVCRDPQDDKFLAAAQAGGAAFIVSEDRDLLDLNSYEGISIITAEACLRVLEEQDRAGS
jgi:putative PIN family toxin of toxin-antitoxin system